MEAMLVCPGVMTCSQLRVKDSVCNVPVKPDYIFECLGLTFVREQHGEGPEHYACEKDGRVLEIYPKKNKIP